MKRKKSLSVIRRNQLLLSRISQTKTDHPLWGYRRIWAYLKYRQGIPVNKKRVYRLMKEQNLIVTPEVRNKAKRGPIKPKPVAQRPDQFWGIDMTKIRMSTWGWLYLTIVLDWHTKEILGYSLSMQSKTDDWLNAPGKAVNLRFPNGIRDSLKDRLFLISDNGCQPTSQRFMMSCSLLGIKQIFTTWSNPKGNSDTERVMRTIKEDIVWPYDWDNPFEFEAALNRWVHDYNNDFPHQSLNNLTPRQFYENYVNKEPISNLKTP
ncbi:MAG: IS3 family transposase [Candidatus Omnitrophota bacterium]